AFFAEALDDFSLGEPARDEQSIRARVLGGAKTAVVAGTLAADLAHCALADTAAQRAGQKVRWVGLDVAALSALESPLPGAPRPCPLDRLPACRRPVPEILGDNSETFVFGDVPFGLRFLELPDPARARVTPAFRPVPDPA